MPIISTHLMGSNRIYNFWGNMTRGNVVDHIQMYPQPATCARISWVHKDIYVNIQPLILTFRYI